AAEGVALPAGGEGDVLPVRRERGVVGVPDETRLLARAEVEYPDVPVPEGAEDVARLELAPRRARANERDRGAVGRPGRLDVVEGARGARRLAASGGFAREDLAHAVEVG